MTNLIVNFRDGSKWSVPAKVIAENRARYFADSDPETTFGNEVDFAMQNDYELTDWAKNNMNWSDVAPHAIRIGDRPADYDEEWTNAEMEIVR